MYYEEKYENNKLYCKTSPDGKWREVPLKIVVHRLQKARYEIEQLKREIECLKKEK